MDNLDDSENNAKISDSAYSNSCSNSHSRRSHSSKSMRSGSNSSGSSGYGGKPSTSDYSGNLGQPPEKRSRDVKKKKQVQLEMVASEVQVELESRVAERTPGVEAVKEKPNDVAPLPIPVLVQTETGVENMDIVTPEKNNGQDETDACTMALADTSANFVASQRPFSSNGFSCVISMHDGVVIYTTTSLTTSLGFPRHMWIGRSFIDFIHPRDRYTFASQITNGLAVPKNANGIQEKALLSSSVSTMVCRIRRYRGLNSGFAVKERSVVYLPFLLKLSFKNINDEEGKVIYLVLQATQFHSAFKTSNEMVTNPIPFVIRHSANGHLEYIDPESVPYLGYLPQDLSDKDALQLYHPDDLMYLRQVYETIVKEGGVPCSDIFRVMSQNGDYLKVKTEWSSFINPWSRKLEFVIGKHHVMEGPTNPDVFQSPMPEKAIKLTADEKNKALTLRENIVRIMNEVLTKPAEAAKQHMTKRCQDLASFMESLIEEQPKADEELRLDIQEPDHSYYERDSVMLGGISPHHDYNDSKSSTETPLSYNQLNYNDNMQRYFNSHQPYSYEDYNTATGENILDLKNSMPVMGNCLSPMAQYSGDSVEMLSSSESCGFVGDVSPIALVDYLPMRLTEATLNKHNSVMEKELVKLHRENRSCSKGDREKASNETRLKKKEHLARCNSAFQTTAGHIAEPQPHGVKRSSNPMEMEAVAHKHQCMSHRQHYRKHITSAAPALPSSTITTTVAAQPWASTNPMNMLVLGVGVPQQMSIMNPVAAVPGIFPMYYPPGPQPATTNMINSAARNNHQQCKQHSVPYMMYGQAVYGSPFLYSPIPQVSHPLHDNSMAQTQHFSSVKNTMSSTNKSSMDQKLSGTSNLNGSLKTKMHPSSMWRVKNRARSKTATSNVEGLEESADSNSSTNNALNRNTDAITDLTTSRISKSKSGRLGNTEDRTDGESSYSSFYSSFFKTDSGSAEESGDLKKVEEQEMNTKTSIDESNYYQPQDLKRVPRRKMEPPWMEQVCVTSELVYKYQILTKSLEEVLTADKQKISHFEQPSLVNEQLGQLYLDLQLEGVASRLTLEEGITSSSSSSEESSNKPVGSVRRKREYSKLVLIYEEETPLPPPLSDEEPMEPIPSTSKC